MRPYPRVPTNSLTALLASELLDYPRETAEPPRSIPADWLKEFTVLGPDGYQAGVQGWYFNQRYLGEKAAMNVWTEERVNEWKAKAQAGTLAGTYGMPETNELIRGMRESRALVGQPPK